MALPIINSPKNSSCDIDYWKETLASKNIDKRLQDFKTIGSPLFTYDELDTEYKNALKKISQLESKIFKLQQENAELLKHVKN